MVGCVEKNSWNELTSHFVFGNGLSIQSAETESFLMDSMVESLLIFCSAEIRAFLSFVSSTLHASARYSLFLEIESWTKGKTRYHRARSASPIVISIIFNWFQSLESESLHIYKPDLNIISQIAAIAQMNTITVTIRSQSLFIICVNSWAATASISCLLSFSMIHLENTIQHFFGFHQTAKAFRL